MKQYLIILSACCLLAVACKKSEGGSSRFAFYNATHSIAALTFAFNGTDITTASALAQGQSSGSSLTPYGSLPAGTNNFIAKAGTRTFLNNNAYTVAGSAYTFLSYDSTATDSSVHTIFLLDDLALPDTASAKCRFINCAADTMVLVPVLLNNRDTLALPNGSFIGKNPSASTVQSFVNVKKGKYKFFLVQQASPNAIVFTGTDSLSLIGQSIYSFIYSGLKAATGAKGIKFNIITHPAL
jgi:hypothetical protein